MQMVPIELGLRLKDASQSQAAAPLKKSIAAPPEPHGARTIEPVYVGVLGTQPFVPPPCFTRPTGLPPPSPHMAKKIPASLAQQQQQQQVTPDNLRFLGKSVERFRSDIRDINRGVHTVQDRIILQHQELQRQLSKLAQMTLLIQRLKQAAEGPLEERVRKVGQRQQELLKRIDRVLQGLMDSYSPKLSEFEQQWFSELGRMNGEIVGKDDGRSLKARCQLVSLSLCLQVPIVVPNVSMSLAIIATCSVEASA